MEREMQALGPSCKGKPIGELTTMLQDRFGTDLDSRNLERCAAAMSAGERVELRAPAAPVDKPRFGRGGDRDRDRDGGRDRDRGWDRDR